MRHSNHSITTNVLFALGLTVAIQATVVAQDDLNRLPPTQISIDSAILASFTDEPCHHFEEARARLAAADARQAADHLRIGAAFLKLEAARATPQGHEPLAASIRELEELAEAVEQGAVRATSPLDAAFMRAHYALAGHHCIKAAHRCCQVNTLQHQAESQQSSQDLRAAAKHLERASWWGQQEVDFETAELLQKSHLAADALSSNAPQAHDNATQAIVGLSGKLEKLTGRKIMLAPQVTEADELGPSIFR
ncbi:MAG: hypothetical protein H6822_02580 [Planctomycetaceae bacterium]|nr:hypothetical protein [Planctomycetaceae bacterium]